VQFKLSFSTETIHEQSSLDSLLDKTDRDPERTPVILSVLSCATSIPGFGLCAVCGHDTAKLGSAIMATQLAVKTLKDA
jgi:hypothetical protein